MKVRVLIDGLPFNTEGYQRAESILVTKFGKPSVVSNKHIQCVMSLPSIIHTSVEKIHDFHEKLITRSQALDTTGKLKEINGYIRLTLDKPPTICVDLVQTDNDWQKWDFWEFVKALRKWSGKNQIPLENKRKLIQQKEKDFTRQARMIENRKLVYTTTRKIMNQLILK